MSFCIKCLKIEAVVKKLCRPCYRHENYIRNIKTTKTYNLANKDKINEHKKAWAKKNKHKKKKYSDIPLTDRLRYGKEYRQKNSEKIKAHKRKYNKSENGRIVKNHLTNKRRATILNATPNWVDNSELLRIYKNCPKGMEVDHILPLQGKEVCGMHVPWNLQYLTRSENAKKSAKLILP